jgi:hypothetical protein
MRSSLLFTVASSGGRKTGRDWFVVYVDRKGGD